MENNSQLQKNSNTENNLNKESNLLSLLNMYENNFLCDCKIINNSTQTIFKYIN